MELRSVNDIMEAMCDPKHEFNIILNNISNGCKQTTGALISEIAISFLNRKDKINSLLSIGYEQFKYYFIATATRQLTGNRTGYKKVNVFYDSYLTDFSQIEIDDDSEDVIKEKIEFEEKLQLIDEVKRTTEINFFEAEMFRLKYKNGWSYRQIEREYGISYQAAYQAVKVVKEKIIDYLNGNTN